MATRKKRRINLTPKEILRLKTEVYDEILYEAEEKYPEQYKMAEAESNKVMNIMEEMSKKFPKFDISEYIYWMTLAVFANSVANNLNKWNILINGEPYNIAEDQFKFPEKLFETVDFLLKYDNIRA